MFDLEIKVFSQNKGEKMNIRNKKHLSLFALSAISVTLISVGANVADEQAPPPENSKYPSEL
ncbi:hypothetical protein C2U68_17540 [Methylomonas koyamae]|nr:hypothetical protein C2U68_17540 [Methylomonas koyamae]